MLMISFPLPAVQLPTAVSVFADLMASDMVHTPSTVIVAAQVSDMPGPHIIDVAVSTANSIPKDFFPFKQFIDVTVLSAWD
jgi:hypothetical protein